MKKYVWFFMGIILSLNVFSQTFNTNEDLVKLKNKYKNNLYQSVYRVLNNDNLETLNAKVNKFFAMAYEKEGVINIEFDEGENQIRILHAGFIDEQTFYSMYNLFELKLKLIIKEKIN